MLISYLSFSFLSLTFPLIYLHTLLHRFSYKDDVGSASLVKSSVGRAIRAKIVEQYPNAEKYMDEIMPKKDQVYTIKWYVLCVCACVCVRVCLSPYLSCY